VRSMRDSYEITRDGPYLRVVLPDVVPPDWDAIEGEIAAEVDEGATRIMVVAGDRGSLDTHGDRLDTLVEELETQGLTAVVVVCQDDATTEGVRIPATAGVTTN